MFLERGNENRHPFRDGASHTWNKMTTKEKLLELFESSRDVYLSGEGIAQKLSVSRAAVWKAVKALQNEGYPIDAVTKKGYCLSNQTDILSAQGIRKYLRSEIQNNEICVMDVAESTNASVRDKANMGKPEGYMILANEQTAGRGRLGRSFFSPKDSGIYMSLLLRPGNYSSKQAARITTMAAVAICEAIEEVSEEKAEIKWVNDVFVRGKKVCGILTEGAFNLESGLLDYAVLGVGINVYQPQGGFPDELSPIAGAVFQEKQNDAKNRLVSTFLNRFYGYYHAGDSTDYVEEYRKRSFVIGKQVTLTAFNESKNAVVVGIDEECRLLVKYPDGTQECFSSGEISVCV